MIYHITSRTTWDVARALGYYVAPSLDAEGFIHCSTREQILPVANSVFRGQADLVILCIDESKLKAQLKWEAPAHPNQSAAPQIAEDVLFPHIYGSGNGASVVRVVEFPEGENGFALPVDLPE